MNSDGCKLDKCKVIQLDPKKKWRVRGRMKCKKGNQQFRKYGPMSRIIKSMDSKNDEGLFGDRGSIEDQEYAAWWA